MNWEHFSLVDFLCTIYYHYIPIYFMIIKELHETAGRNYSYEDLVFV